jgi:hypothetical protein
MRDLRKSICVVGAAALISVSCGGAFSVPAADESHSNFCWMSVSNHYSACFHSEAEVLADVRAVTGQALVYPSEGLSSGTAHGSPGASQSVSPVDATVATAYVLATIYDDQNYEGGSYTFTDTHSTTCGGYNYTFDIMPGGWDNRVSSFKSYGSCKTRLSENTNQGGRSVGPVSSKAYVGDAMNDKASSAFITG